MIYIKKFLAVAIFLLIPALQFAQIRIVLTAALSQNYFEFRKNQYIGMFEQLADFGYVNPYVVEALVKKGPTFLDDYSNNVFYASTNNPHLVNKGANEAKTMLEGLQYFDFDPEDMILKVTGRYKFVSNRFLQCVHENEHYDAIVKLDPHEQVHTLCFAMKVKHLKEMFASINYVQMEKHRINLEREVANFINGKKAQGNFQVLYVPKLDVEANLLGSTACPGATGIATF